MNLSEFILANTALLVDDWMVYARHVSPDDYHLSEKQLRDSSLEILQAIVGDMRRHQTAGQRLENARGDRNDNLPQFRKTAHEHADDRIIHGFDVKALVAEYRALRANILRRWLEDARLGGNALEESMRFNEAIDFMVAESVERYAEQTEKMRDLFAGVLAHDMRSPISAILNSVEVILHDADISGNTLKATVNIQRSAVRFKRMIDDLYVFTRTRLGKMLPLEVSDHDLGRICNNAADEVGSACPECEISVEVEGDLTGCWDGARLNELLVNLLTNAAKYGDGRAQVRAVGNGDEITVTVTNPGVPIPEDALPTLFDPMTQAGSPRREIGDKTSMGLGLFICRSIAESHQGDISVSSRCGETVFTVHLPRVAKAATRNNLSVLPH